MPMTLPKARLAGALLAAALAFAPAAGSADPLLEETVELTGTILFLEANVPGMVIGVIRNGESIVRGYGKAAAGSDRAPDGDTMIRIGSITKVFAGATLASMVADGSVSFTDTVQSRSPWQISVPTRDGNAIRLIDLATHTSGLAREPELPGAAPGTPIDTADDLGKALAATELRYAPGTGMLYSNFAFDVLALSLAHTAGKPYATLLKERILDPAGLKDTVFALRDGDAARVFQGHNFDGTPMEDVVTPVTQEGSGSLFSTPNDMLRWLAWHLDRFGADQELRLLDQTAYVQRDGLDPVFGLDEAAPMDAMGLGWVMLAPQGHSPLILNKSGGYLGTLSYVAFAPTRGVGVFVSINQFNFAAFPIMTKIANDLIAQLAPR